jgi:hypothetical protein
MSYQYKKMLAGLAALGALGLGGSAIAGAASNDTPAKAPTAIEQSEAAEAPGTEMNEAAEATEATEAPGSEAAEKGETPDAEEQVAPADEQKAKDAALAEVGSGTANEVSAETPDKGEKADTPEKGDTPDPAYEQQIAYDVEVTKADGSAVEVHLDKSFQVLGTEKADQDQDQADGEQNEAVESAQR